MKKTIGILIGIIVLVAVIGAGAFFFLQKDIDQAREIAYERIDDESAELAGEKTDRDFIFTEYDFTFVSDTHRYEVTVNGFGQVDDFEKETLPATPSQSTNSDNNSADDTNAAADIGMKKAQEIALGDHANGVVTDSDKDFEGNRTVYEIEILDNNMEYDYVIDASTGEVLHVKEEYAH